jgi:undecaprenyl-diphosphatase
MRLLDFDLLILKFFNHPTFPFNYISLLLTEAIYISIFLLAYFFYKMGREKFFHFALSFSFGFIFSMLLKYLINRPRPFIAFSEITTVSLEPTPSFPSTHTFMAFFLLYFVLRNFKTRKKFFALFYLLSIPFLLMYIGAHYPTDLIAGAIIGYLFPIFVSEKFSSILIKKLSFQKRINK